MTKREAELEALARFAAAGKVKKLAPVREKDPDENFAPRPLTYTLAERMVQVKRTDELSITVPLKNPPKLVWWKLKEPRHVDCDCMSCRPP